MGSSLELLWLSPVPHAVLLRRASQVPHSSSRVPVAITANMISGHWSIKNACFGIPANLGGAPCLFFSKRKNDKQTIQTYHSHPLEFMFYARVISVHTIWGRYRDLYGILNLAWSVGRPFFTTIVHFPVHAHIRNCIFCCACTLARLGNCAL